MRGMFDNARPDPTAVSRVKAIFSEVFDLSDDVLLSVAELRCHEPHCPPIETVVTARIANGETKDWRVHKPISEVDEADVRALSTKT